MAKRPLCPKCGFIMMRCLCSHLEFIENKMRIIILQHPSEKTHALNSVQLMKKSFRHISIFTGEDFSSHSELNALIKEKKESLALIFPGDGAHTLIKKEVETPSIITHLILIDGTWKKAKKIFILSENLHGLRRFHLPPFESLYKIRKSPFQNGLSTLEATVRSLEIIEPELKCHSLLEAFSKMIEFQIEKMGQEMYLKNYPPKK